MSVREIFRKLLGIKEKTMEERDKRIRAWVLVKDVSPEIIENLKEMRTNWEKKKNPEIVVIRIDGVLAGTIVNGTFKEKEFNYKYVMPIDASEDRFKKAISDLEKIIGSGNSLLLKVNSYDPPYPQDASGYITDFEFGKGEKHSIKDHLKPKRQDYSPGFNPWG